jgi:kynurenine formamidase
MYLDLSLPITVNEAELQTTVREESLLRLGHKGTHLDRILRTAVPLEYFKSRAVSFDVSDFSQKRPVEADDLPLEHLRADDFVLIHTGAMKRHGYGSREYLDDFFELSWNALDLLIERRVRFIGIDARGIRQNAEHREADARCEKSGVYVIENINDAERLPMLSPFTMYTMCFDMGGTGIPCRVIAEVSGERKVGDQIPAE